MNPEEDKEFLYIAKEGLKAPLPQPWRACRTQEGEIYYFNFQTGVSQWEHPLDEFYKKKFQDTKALLNKGLKKELQDRLRINLGSITGNTGSSSSYQSNNNQQAAPQVLQKVPSQSNIKQNASNLQDSGISPLSYSQNTYSAFENPSGLQGLGDDQKNMNLDEAREELNESINFSDLQEEYKSKRSEASKVQPENNENKDYNALLKKFEDDLILKFDSAIAECENNYQKEAKRIQENFEAELKKAREDDSLPKDAGLDDRPLEEKKKELEAQILKENEKEIEKNIMELKSQFEKAEKEIEDTFQKELDAYLKEFKIGLEAEIVIKKKV